MRYGCGLRVVRGQLLSTRRVFVDRADVSEHVTEVTVCGSSKHVRTPYLCLLS